MIFDIAYTIAIATCPQTFLCAIIIELAEISAKEADGAYTSCNIRSIVRRRQQMKLISSTLQGVLQAPKARKEPYTVKAPHGKERIDDYYWLRDDDRENSEVLQYLKVRASIYHKIEK